MGLHTKAVVVDGKRVFIGSMNIDSRPWQMNGEIGVNVEGTGLAADLQPPASLTAPAGSLCCD